MLALISGIVAMRYITNDSFPIMTNIEALAQVEHGKYIKCYNRIKTDPMDIVRYCGNCEEIPGTWKSGMDFCLP